jgi:hypothetical protein
MPLNAPLRHGDAQDQRKIFTRTIRSVTWLPEEGRLELRLILPQPEEEATTLGARVDSFLQSG